MLTSRDGYKDEREFADELGLDQHSGSGNKRRAPQDASCPYHLMAQFKATGKKSITINLVDLDDLTRDARIAGVKPIFGVTWIDGRKRRWVMLPLDIFLEGDYDALAQHLRECVQEGGEGEDEELVGHN